MYDAGEACGDASKTIPVPNIVQQYNISKIALIQQSTRCFLADKLLYVQNNGAIGAIVFHNTSATENTSFQYGSMVLESLFFFVNNESIIM